MDRTNTNGWEEFRLCCFPAAAAMVIRIRQPLRPNPIRAAENESERMIPARGLGAKPR